MKLPDGWHNRPATSAEPSFLSRWAGASGLAITLSPTRPRSSSTPPVAFPRLIRSADERGADARRAAHEACVGDDSLTERPRVPSTAIIGGPRGGRTRSEGRAVAVPEVVAAEEAPPRMGDHLGARVGCDGLPAAPESEQHACQPTHACHLSREARPCQIGRRRAENIAARLIGRYVPPTQPQLPRANPLPLPSRGMRHAVW